MKKKGSVRAETSLSAVELSGKVIKRGFLLKQVSKFLVIMFWLRFVFSFAHIMISLSAFGKMMLGFSSNTGTQEEKLEGATVCAAFRAGIPSLL